MKDVVEATKELKKRQATPDPPEALACIPSLQLSDIPKEAAAIPSDVSTTSGGTTLLTHDLFTNNVLYAEAALPLGRVPARLLPLLPLFCRCDSTAAACHCSSRRFARSTVGPAVFLRDLGDAFDVEPSASVSSNECSRCTIASLGLSALLHTIRCFLLPLLPRFCRCDSDAAARCVGAAA